MSRLEQLQKLLAAEPQDVFVNFALAMELFKAGRHEEALAQFGKVSELDPDYVPAYFQKGNSLMTLGRREEAKAVLRQGVEAARRTGNSHAASEMTELLDAMG